MAWTEVPIHCQLQDNPEVVKRLEEREIVEKETKIQKGQHQVTLLRNRGFLRVRIK